MLRNRALRTAQVHVKAGHELLVNVIGEDYYKSIDLETLDMSSCENCILGQVAGRLLNGGYGTAAVRLGFHSQTPKQARHGFHFMPGHEDIADAYWPLQRIWHRRIAKLQGRTACGRAK